MIVNVPLTIGDANLVSTNIPENDYGGWNVGTAYTVGNNCISTTSHQAYECLIAHTGQDPDTNPVDGNGDPYWLTLGATNRWKAFDQKISDPVVNTAGSTVEYEINANGSVPITAVTLLGCSGQSAQLVVTDPTDGEVFNKTVSLIDTTMIVDWYAYHFDPARVKAEAIFENIPPYASAAHDITVTDTSDDPQLGQAALGQSYTLGVTLYGTTVSIDDYSVKDRDDFGNAIIVERPFARIVDFDFVVQTSHARRVQLLLSQLRATPAVFHAGTNTEQYGTTVYGFPLNFSINLAGPTKSEVTLEVESLT